MRWSHKLGHFFVINLLLFVFLQSILVSVTEGIFIIVEEKLMKIRLAFRQTGVSLRKTARYWVFQPAFKPEIVAVDIAVVYFKPVI